MQSGLSLFDILVPHALLLNAYLPHVNHRIAIDLVQNWTRGFSDHVYPEVILSPLENHEGMLNKTYACSMDSTYCEDEGYQQQLLDGVAKGLQRIFIEQMHWNIVSSCCGLMLTMFVVFRARQHPVKYLDNL
ncbi:hypothetical protein Tco_0397896 [Tanacetum coccineum]|uniref:Uncharacterized protein n=1 Tax=Tanacetum coccineum TaxID=301880 RepID=A0ABQ5BNJ1_9ASTR